MTAAKTIKHYNDSLRILATFLHDVARDKVVFQERDKALPSVSRVGSGTNVGVYRNWTTGAATHWSRNARPPFVLHGLNDLELLSMT